MVPTHPVACENGQTAANRRAALAAGYFGMFVTIFILFGAWADARNKDRIKEAQLAAMTEQDIAESVIEENLGFGRATIAADGRVIKWSGALPKWTRWSSAEAVGQPLVSIIPEPMRAAHVAAFNAAVAKVKAGEKYQTPVVECQLPRIDDPTKTTHVTIVTNIVKNSKLPDSEPLIVAHVYRTKSLQRVSELTAKENE